MPKAYRSPGPRHDEKFEPKLDEQQRMAQELQRADRCIADLRQRLGAVEQTLSVVNSLTASYAKHVDLSTRPIAPSVAARHSPHRSSLKQK